MTQEILLYTLALNYIFRNRIRKEHDLLEKYGDAVEVWKHIDEKNTNDALYKAQKEVEFIQKHNIEVFYIKDETYPYRLRNCPDAPVLLYGKGTLNLNKGHFLSVVGTRNADERGKQLTKRLIFDLHALCPDITIISGLAYGIDVSAHRAALEVGLPTIIIPGHGLDKIYPALHRQVVIDAMPDGGILTEFMSGTQPEKSNFILRNRIIAGLSDATIIVESKDKGGSLITARCASEYNREVFAFPGRVDDEVSKGCNQLIKKNVATLLESALDIVETMQWAVRQSEPKLAFRPRYADLSQEENDILTIISQYEDGVHINEIIEQAKCQYQYLTPILINLELKKLIKVLPGGMYIKL